MYLKRLLLITFVTSILGLVFLYTAMVPLVFSLYGYPAGLVNEFSAASFDAMEETFFARLTVFAIIFGNNLACLISALIALKRRIYLRFHLTQMAFAFSLILSLYYLVVLMVSVVALGRRF